MKRIVLAMAIAAVPALAWAAPALAYDSNRNSTTQRQTATLCNSALAYSTLASANSCNVFGFSANTTNVAVHSRNVSQSGATITVTYSISQTQNNATWQSIEEDW
jgi:hypothetical protein